MNLRTMKSAALIQCLDFGWREILTPIPSSMLSILRTI